jgi:hypothetical protein
MSESDLLNDFVNLFFHSDSSGFGRSLCRIAPAFLLALKSFHDRQTDNILRISIWVVQGAVS